MENKDFKDHLQKFDFIRLSTPDLNGIHLSKLVPSRHADKIAHNECDSFCGVIGFGFRNEDSHLSDMLNERCGNGPIRPIPSTLRSLPWAGDEQTAIAECIFESMWSDGTEISAHPRLVARRQLEKLEELGYLLYSAFEPEFRVFKKDHLYEPVTPCPDIYRTGNLIKFEKFCIKMEKMFQIAGIDVQDYTVEHGQSQLETPLRPKIGIEAADMAFSFRQATKEIALKEGFQVSFMTKPLPNQSSNGWHFNHSLLHAVTVEPVMFDEKDKNGFSDVMLHWLGGIMEHVAALTALTSPTVNCYRRLHKGLAPDMANWNIDDRFKAVRVKNKGPKGTYVELRTPSSAACPYHVLAATVAAGMDGLKRKLLPPPPAQMDAPALPKNLSEALELLESDKILVEALGSEFIEWFVKMKRRTCLVALMDVDLHKDDEEGLKLERERYFEFA